MSSQRSLRAEWLDDLAPDDPRAVGSRRDLQRLNACMGHGRLAAHALRSIFRQSAPTSIVDLGAGDGRFFLQVARRAPDSWRGVNLSLVDSKPAATPETLHAFTRLGWQANVHTAEVLDWMKGPFAAQGQTFVANLFLHHLSEAQLMELFSICARQGRALIALEPRRSLWAALCSRLCGLIGCNAVTRHDAPASVQAGFSGNELSRLWPQDPGWLLHEGPAGLFTHQFIAVSAGAIPSATTDNLTT
jgi:hypothetical protein